MHPLAREVLEQLWRSADGAALRASPRTPRVMLSAKHCPSYTALPTRADKESFHAELLQAQRLGAIEVTWDERAGTGGQIERVSLASLAALAQLLERRTTQDKLEAARLALAPWLQTRPVCAQLLAAWEQGRSPRGVSIDALAQVTDALTLLDHCQKQQFIDVSERRVSAQLFGDSKRIEALITVLDLLTSDRFDQSEARHPEATLAALGLLKHPLPLLVAGPVTILTQGAQGLVESAKPAPYLGFPPRQVRGAQGSPAYALSVENLTIFHELANGQAGELRGVIVYTGGFPSPSQLRAYQALVSSFSLDTVLWHWGDTDLGGFRIAALLAEHADRPLKLWNMARYDDHGVERALTPHDVTRISRLCDRWEWPDEKARVVQDPRRIEQELQRLILPD